MRVNLTTPLICETCHIPFFLLSSKNQRFCSRACRRYPNRKPRTPRDLAERFWEKVDKSGDCWLWTAGTSNGYGRFALGRGKGVVYAHRFAYTLTYGPIADDLFACHRCDTPLCVRPDHLFTGTDADNKADMVAKGRGPLGERQANAKLTTDAVLAIRREHADGSAKVGELARRYGVHPLTVSAVVHRRSWRHLL